MSDKTTGGVPASPDQPVKRKRGRPKGSTSGYPRTAHPVERIKVIDKPDPVEVVLDNMDDQDGSKPYTIRHVELTDSRRPGNRNANEYGADRTNPGDNSRFVSYALMSLDLPTIDTADPEQVKKRLMEYFTFCMDHDRKPSLIGMANWLGVEKPTVDKWKRGEVRESTHTPIIRRAVALLEELSVDYFQNGKVNPAAGIFLLKNMFQYKDVQDVVVTPNNPLGDAAQQGQLEDKYLDIVDAPDDSDN